MKRQTLEFDLDFNFMVFAISCHEPDYKFCLQLNSILGIQLEKEFPLSQKDNRFIDDFLFSFFSYHQEDIQLTYQLITNKSYNSVTEKINDKVFNSQASLFEQNDKQNIDGKITHFIPELNGFDYLFVIRTGYNASFAKRIEEAVQEIPFVNKIQYVELEDLNSRELLIWE